MAMAVVWALFVLAAASSANALGSIASIESFPSVVQIEFHVHDSWVQLCAGSVLTSAHILSVAQCFSGVNYTPENRRIRAGSATRGVGGQVATIHSAILHPDFGLLGHDSDIAVARLDTYLMLGASVQQAHILGQGIELPLGLAVQFAGWGDTAKAENSDDLYSLELKVNDNENCLIQYLLTEERPTVTENMLCAGLDYNRGKDFDDVDIGAPLSFDNTLVGLSSFGVISEDNLPLVATGIGPYTQWIIDSATL